MKIKQLMSIHDFDHYDKNQLYPLLMIRAFTYIIRNKIPCEGIVLANQGIAWRCGA